MFGNINDILASKTMEEMAKYADHVCANHARDIDFNRRMSSSKVEKHELSNLNGTSFGNIAYMCIHGHPDYVEKWKNELRQIVKDTGVKLQFDIV
jgi:hypothetical protein